MVEKKKLSIKIYKNQKIFKKQEVYSETKRKYCLMVLGKKMIKSKGRNRVTKKRVTVVVIISDNRKKCDQEHNRNKSHQK